MKTWIFLTTYLLIFLLVSCKNNTTNMNNTDTSNPFYVESTLPFQAIPFDKIKDSDYSPAYEKGMQEHLAEIEQIANITA